MSDETLEFKEICSPKGSIFPNLNLKLKKVIPSQSKKS